MHIFPERGRLDFFVAESWNTRRIVSFVEGSDLWGNKDCLILVFFPTI